MSGELLLEAHEPECLDVTGLAFETHHWCNVGAGYECCANCGQLRIAVTKEEP